MAEAQAAPQLGFTPGFVMDLPGNCWTLSLSIDWLPGLTLHLPYHCDTALGCDSWLGLSTSLGLPCLGLGLLSWVVGALLAHVLLGRSPALAAS